MKAKSKNIFYISLIFVAILIVSGVCLRCEAIDTKDKKIEIETDKGVDIKVETKIEEELIETITEKTEPVFYLSDYERWVAECIVMGESEGESYEGQVLVAQCLLNACLRDRLQPSEVREKYKYSGWNEEPSENIKNVVNAVFDDGYKVTEEFILYFYAPKYSKGKWHETQRFIIEVGGHRFFAEWNIQ